MSPENEKVNQKGPKSTEKAERTTSLTIKYIIKERKRALRINFLYSGIYQAFGGAFLLAFAFVFLQALDGMEILYPIITIRTVPVYNAVGWTIIVLSFLQIAYASLFNYLVKSLPKKMAHRIGMTLCILMLPVIPVGTYFGIYCLSDLKKVFGIQSQSEQDKQNREGEKAKKSKNDESVLVGATLISSGLLMLHLPIALLLVFWFLITMPADMAYPLLSVNQTAGWEIVSWVLFGIFLAQVLYGLLYARIKEESKNLAKIGAYFFAFIEATSISLWMQTFIGLAGPALGLEGGLNVALYFVWVLGLLMNPLGLHNAHMIIKELKVQ